MLFQGSPQLKTKQYTVSVRAIKEYEYQVTAKGALKAKNEAAVRFRNEHPEHWDCHIECRATADWIEKGATF